MHSVYRNIKQIQINNLRLGSWLEVCQKQPWWSYCFCVVRMHCGGFRKSWSVSLEPWWALTCTSLHRNPKAFQFTMMMLRYSESIFKFSSILSTICSTFCRALLCTIACNFLKIIKKYFYLLFCQSVASLNFCYCWAGWCTLNLCFS